jgi:heme-degrading monooxygenase HmoA
MVTFTFFQFQGMYNQWWAFGQMGLRPFKTGIADGLSFAKMLGTGGGNGFSAKPNFQQYGWLGVWDSENQARAFFKTHPLFQQFTKKAVSYGIVYVRPTMAHGKWDGIEPFTVENKFDSDRPTAVLTRATIKTQYLRRFWQYVPKVSKSIDDYAENRLFSVGVGELPLIQQATFSLWTSGKAMMDYAYKNPYHAEVVKKTRELGWYSEELFARFEVVDFEGVGTYVGILKQKKDYKII